jgi:D-glycero-alpha-D-manno-heptose-7-phosphate kinase
MQPFPEKILIDQGASIEDAFRHLNENEMGIVFAVDGDKRLVGCLTDGDIRRQLLESNDLTRPISTFLNRNFVRADTQSRRENILKLLDHGIHVIPMLDSSGRLARLCTRKEFQIQGEVEVFARARAPARISFGGGGSDLTHYFLDNGGVVINSTIAKYAHASLRRRADGSVRIYSHDLDTTVELETLGDMRFDGKLDLIKSVVQLISPSEGFDLEVSTDFPVGSGLGGSASLAVAIIGCFNEFRSDAWTRHQIAEMAFQAERLHLDLAGGWQDQYAAAFGGFNFMEFSADENLIIPLRLDADARREIEACTILCYTGKGHNSGKIHDEQKKHMQSSDQALAATQRQKEITLEMKRRLLRGDVYGYGALLRDAWQAKREMGNLISDSELDRLHDHAIASGAIGGKILGAGGGGYFMFFVPPFRRYQLMRAMEAAGYTCEGLLMDEAGLTSWKMRIPAGSAAV